MHEKLNSSQDRDSTAPSEAEEKVAIIEIPVLPPDGGGKPRKSKARWLWLAVLLLVVGGVLYYYHLLPGTRVTDDPAASKTSANSISRGDAGAGRPTPVVTTKVLRGDIGVYKTGLGAVTPIYTVTVKSRVDGQLMQVNFKEGDNVHEGDLLVQLDPRPFQVALESGRRPTCP